jgi:NAD(P)-dependent dehydrogenase (short-subunit alcohol dehydrogenase family)
MNKTVVITGANRGIGLALAHIYLQHNWHVIATCRDPQSADSLNELAESPNLHIYALEVTDAHSVKRLAKMLTGRPIHVLINNAGIKGSARQRWNDLDYAAWLDTFAVNTLAPIHIASALIGNLRLAGTGRIVNISSQMGALGRTSGGGSYAYRTSKAALNKASQLLASDLKADGIIVIPVHPGWVRTDMGGANGEISAEESAQGIYHLVENLTLSHSGRFWNWDGREHVW